MNTRLINRVVEHITKFPETYNQNIVAEECEISKQTPCGAIACFGGWTVLLGVPKSERHEAAQEHVALREAGRLLGLTGDESKFLFDISESDDPKENLRIIKRRLKAINQGRKIATRAIADWKKISEYVNSLNPPDAEVDIKTEDTGRLCYNVEF